MGRLSDNKLRELFLDEIEDYVKDQEDRHRDLWTVYLNELSASKWNNRIVQDLLDHLFNNWDDIFRDTARRNDEDEDVARNYIPDFIDHHMAASVMSNSRLTDKLDNRTYDKLAALADRWNETFGRRARNAYRNDRDRDRDRGRNSRDRERDRDRRDRDSRYRDNTSRNRDRHHDERTSATNSWSAMSDIAAEREDQEDRERRERAQRERERDNDRTRSSSNNDTRDPHDRGQEVETVVHQTRPSGPDYSSPRPHDNYFIGEYHLQVAHSSTFKLTPLFNEEDPGVPIPAAFYDARNTVRYLKRDINTDIVTEEFVAMNEDLRYLAHQQLYSETSIDNGNARRQHLSIRARQGKVEGDEQAPAVEEAKPVTLDEVLQAAIKRPIEGASVINETDEIAVTRLKAAMYAAEEKAWIEQGITRKIVHVKGDVAQNEELLNRFGNAANLAEAANILLDNKAAFDPAIYQFLDSRMSDLMQIVLRYQFQYGAIKSFSFANDWVPHVIPHLVKNCGMDFVQTLNQRCQHISSTAAMRAPNAELGDYLGDIYTTPEELATFKGFVFVGFQVVGVLDYTADELGVGKILVSDKPNTAIDKGYGSVNMTNGSQLSQTLRKLYSLMPELSDREKNNAVVHLYTQEGRRIFIVPHSARQQNFVLFDRQ